MNFFIFLIIGITTFVHAQNGGVTLNDKTGLVMRVADRYCDQGMTKRVETVGPYSLIKFFCKKNIMVNIIVNVENFRFIRAELKQNEGQRVLILAVLDQREDFNSRAPAGPVKRISNQLLAIYDNTSDKKQIIKKETKALNKLLASPVEDSKAIAKLKALME